MAIVEPPRLLPFLTGNARLLSFGLALTFYSSFGQTFFIGLFNEPVRDAIGLSEEFYGALYSGATLLSGVTIIRLGQRLDVADLRRYTLLTVLGLAAAALLLGFAQGVIMVAMAFYLLRLCGQGLMGHISLTTMARAFNKRRGVASSIASMGFPLGEAVLPIIAVASMAAFGWRWTWIGAAAVLVITTLPLIIWLLTGDLRTALAPRAAAKHDDGTDVVVSGARRRDVLRDPSFYLVLPAVITPAFVMTGFFFHQATLIRESGWSTEVFAAMFVAFAAAQVASAAGVGVLIDRFTAIRMTRLFLVPMFVAMATLAFFDSYAALATFMIAAGVTSGAVGPVVSAMWAEAYGVAHLGAIRALGQACMVFSTAAAPATLGVLIGRDVPMATQAGVCAGGVAVTTLLTQFAFRARRRTDPAQTNAPE